MRKVIQKLRIKENEDKGEMREQSDKRGVKKANRRKMRGRKKGSRNLCERKHEIYCKEDAIKETTQKR